MTVTITKISGIGTKTAEILTKHGFKSVKAIAGSTVENLSSVPGFGSARARTTIKAATALLADPPSSTPKVSSSTKPERAVSKKAARVKTKPKAKTSKKSARTKSSDKEKLRNEKLKKAKQRKEKLKKEKQRKEKLRKEKLRKEKPKKAKVKAKKKQKRKKR
jgi:hypothetical protein